MKRIGNKPSISPQPKREISSSNSSYSNQKQDIFEPKKEKPLFVRLAQYFISRPLKDDQALIEQGLEAVDNYIKITGELPPTKEQTSALKAAFKDSLIAVSSTRYLSELQKKQSNVIQSHIQIAHELLHALNEKRLDMSNFTILMQFYGKLKNNKMTHPLQRIKDSINYVEILLGEVTLPATMRDSLTKALHDRQLLEEHHRILNFIENRDVPAQELALEEIATYLASRLKKKQISHETFRTIMRLYNCLANIYAKKPYNVQFNSDSLGSIMYDKDQTSTGVLYRWYHREEAFWSTLQSDEPPSDMSEEEFKALKLQISQAQTIAAHEFGENTRWEVPDGSIGALTHAGWFNALVPEKDGGATILKAERTLGLMQGHRIAISKVPLDFTPLHALSYDQARTLIDILASVICKEEPTLSKDCISYLAAAVEKGQFTKNEAETAQSIIVKFVEDTTDQINALHRQLTEHEPN